MSDAPEDAISDASEDATSDAPEDRKMPLLDHLIELRRRLFYSVIAIVVLFFICFFFANAFFDFLVAPLADVWQREGRRLIFTALHEKFFTNVKIAFFAAAFIAFPILAAQIWTFVAPGLYRNEKKAFLPFLIFTPLLFFAGGAFVYYLVVPVAWQFFASFEQIAVGGEGLSIELEPKVNEYLSLVMRLIFAFGIAFELPVVMSLLGRAGLLTADGLSRNRRYAIVLAFLAAAILTPPDPVSQISLAIPIILLYEVSIVCVRLIEKRRAAAEAAAAE